MLRKSWVLLLVLVLLLAGCGKPVTPPEPSTTPGGEVFQVALPRIVIDVDKDGNPSVLGLGPAVLKGMGVDLAGMQVPVSTVDTGTCIPARSIPIPLSTAGPSPSTLGFPSLSTSMTILGSAT